MKNILLTILLTLISINTYAQTVPNASPLYNSYSCNGATTQFPYSFYINAPSDIVVQQTDNLGNITYPNNFSVDTTNVWVNYPNPLTSACPTGYTITLYASTPITQNTTYGNRTPFTATAVGSSLNKLTIIDQQLQRQLNQSLLLPVGQTGGTFPSSSPGNYIGWNASGTLSNIPSPANAAVWSLSGANAQFNTGNVSTTGSMTATGGFIGNASSATIASTVTTNANLTGAITSTGNVTSNDFTANIGIGSSSPGQALDVQGTIRGSYLIGSSGVSAPYVMVSDLETNGTGGGTSTGTTWTARVLNTKNTDTGGISSLCTGNGAPVATCTAANQLVLPSGTYLLKATAPFLNANGAQLRLYDVTHSATLIIGQNTMSSNSSTSGGTATLNGMFTLTAISALTIQYWVGQGETNGLGFNISSGVGEVYTVAEFTKVS